MTSALSPYILRDEYVELQNRHDKFLNDELYSIRRSFNQVAAGLEELTADVKTRFDDVNQRFDNFKQRFDELKADNMRTNAYFRNNALRNPTLPIRPIIAFHPDRGILEPDPARFPRHANAFYTLRTPSTPHQHSMLAYLVSFYDIPVPDPSTSDSDDDPESIIIQEPDSVVDQLESILGLNEENFTQFRHRAAQLASYPRPSPPKRSQFAGEYQHALRIKPYKSDSPESDHSDAPASTRLDWGTRSTPSSKRPSANPDIRGQARELARAQERARANRQSSNDDALTSTNTNTSPREPHFAST
ncbi:hypothetical protein LEL_10780 [Akanthomyces lecanii RCEF 1005]|uniref:Wac domain-containing protein n=1 Tax=Akanthomyces lecanii RCEF 1005 TaxID=1081108 RepID=A0A167TSJ1_CORDF|nr:hypothetical protein LEL_10780 [Akanthomyces lecanii RCEF 1005]